MRRIMTSALLTAAMLISLIPTTMAAVPSRIVAMKISSPVCVINNETTQIDPVNSKVTPIAENWRTLVPIRRILESFGGQVTWVPETSGILCSLNGTNVELHLGTKYAMVNGSPVTLDVPAKATNSRTFVPVRFVSENLGLKVGYDQANQIVVIADGDLNETALTALPQVQTLIQKTKPRVNPVTFSSSQYALASGKVRANVLTIDPADPRVSIKANIPYGHLNYTRPFKDICAASGAVAVVNANFFEAYKEVKDPIGHVMVNGQFIYGSSGISSLGITANGEMRYGRPAMFYRVKTVDGGTPQMWSGFELNITKQFANQSVVYTPARGSSFAVQYPGVVLTVQNGVSTGYRNVAKGESVAIPANGFVLYSSTEVTKTHWYSIPEMGRQMMIEPYLFKADEEGFTLDGVQTIISGAPRLVKDGAIETYMEPQYTRDKRFTTSSAPRTAVGTTSAGKLILVNVPGATIQQMRELMFKLGCVDAFNLDGGASTAMYYNGKTICSPGRQLVTTLQICVDN